MLLLGAKPTSPGSRVRPRCPRHSAVTVSNLAHPGAGCARRTGVRRTRGSGRSPWDTGLDLLWRSVTGGSESPQAEARCTELSASGDCQQPPTPAHGREASERRSEAAWLPDSAAAGRVHREPASPGERRGQKCSEELFPKDGVHPRGDLPAAEHVF